MRKENLNDMKYGFEGIRSVIRSYDYCYIVIYANIYKENLILQ